MLIFTLTMKNLLILVFLVSLSTHCQAITVRDSDNIYEPSPKSYVYSDSDLVTEEPPRQDRQLQYFKASRRSERVPSPSYQFSSEDIGQEVEYNYPTRQQLEPRTENYPDAPRNYEQQITKRIGLAVKKPLVEQYLKEVTPTTKTVYNQRPGNYLRLNGQAHVRANKQRTEETQRSILKQSQSPFQYVLQSDLQQKIQVQPHIQYEAPEQKPAQSQQIPELQPQAPGLSAYQNALLAHQKVLESENQGDTSRSSIYVAHIIPKKPIRKIVKPKQSPADEDVDYYTQLQQLQQLQQKQTQTYEPQQPAQVRYQARIPHPKDDAAPTEEPLTYQQEKVVQYQQPRQYQQQTPQYQPATSARQAKKSRQPVKYSPEYQTSPEASRYQTPQSPDPVYEYQTRAKAEEPAGVQYQQPSLKQGPKYLPEPKTLRYQPTTLEETELKYQPVSIPAQQQEALIKYEAAIAKLQAEELGRPREQKVRQQIRYQEEEQAVPVRYQLQYTEENQQVPNQESEESEYVRPEQLSRYRPAGREPAVAYRQSLQNSNVRYFRNLGRPAISYSHSYQ